MMGYYMRYLTTTDQKITLPGLEAALKQIDSAYTIRGDTQLEDTGELLYGNTYCALIEINHPGDEIFDDDITEFQDMIGAGNQPAEQRVRQTLANATAMIALEIFWEGTESEPVLSKIDPLWDWLFANCEGLLQADNEGFYDQGGMILERRFTL